jgi:hypothetical protein
MTKAAADMAKAANVGSAKAADVSAAESTAVSTTEAATVSTTTSTARKRISGQSGGESDSRRQDDHGFT